jgi:hypothetical protein
VKLKSFQILKIQNQHKILNVCVDLAWDSELYHIFMYPIIFINMELIEKYKLFPGMQKDQNKNLFEQVLEECDKIPNPFVYIDDIIGFTISESILDGLQGYLFYDSSIDLITKKTRGRKKYKLYTDNTGETFQVNTEDYVNARYIGRVKTKDLYITDTGELMQLEYLTEFTKATFENIKEKK